MKEQLKGISAAQDAMKEVLQKRLSTVEARMDSFEEKVKSTQDNIVSF